MSDQTELVNRQELRQLLTQRARDAADTHRMQLAQVFASLVDLLQVVDSIEEFGGGESHAATITDFCHASSRNIEKSLEVAEYDDAEDDHTFLREIAREIDSKWGDYLEILSSHDRLNVNDLRGWDDHLESSDALQLEDRYVEEDVDFQSEDLEQLLSGLTTATELLSAPLNEEPTQPAQFENVGVERSENITAPELSDEFFDPEFIPAYLDDAQKCLAGMEASLLELDREPSSVEPMRQFCRELHTLKGASGTVGLAKLAESLHQLESSIEQTIKAKQAVDIDSLLQGIDGIRETLRRLAGAPSETGAYENDGTLPTDVAGDEPGDGFVRIESSRLDRMMDLLAELVMLRNRRDTYIEQLRNIREEVGGAGTRVRLAETSRELSSVAGHSRSMISADEHEEERVSSSFTAMLSEISKDLSEIGRSMQSVTDPLADDNSSISHLIGQFRTELMELRRQPMTGLLRRLHRVVRDASRQENKLVDLEIHGQGTRAERSLQERLYEPLMHIVRNAVSHGIESPSERESNGKPAVGKITITTHSDATSLWLEVKDDGRGLDDEALEARGRELGLIPPGVQYTSEQLWKLILQPGFSTKKDVSEVSGRGIGMDVVASQVQAFRGRVEIDSERGKTTSIRLQIPLRSTIEHAMVVRINGQLFALPMRTVYGTETDEPVDRNHPVVSLQRLLGMKESTFNFRRVITLRHPMHLKPNLTHENSHQRLSISVDEVVGVEEVVLRSLPTILANHDCFSGVTLSGRAETVLVLDTARLIELGLDGERLEPIQAGSRPVPSRNGSQSRSPRGMNLRVKRVLVVDDSLSIRRTMARKLKNFGYDSVEAADGVQALEKLKSENVVGVISDLDMPRMNGISLLGEVRRMPEHSELPFIVCTSRRDKKTTDELESLGVTKVFQKPVSDALVNLVVQAMRKEMTS